MTAKKGKQIVKADGSIRQGLPPQCIQTSTWHANMALKLMNINKTNGAILYRR